MTIHCKVSRRLEELLHKPWWWLQLIFWHSDTSKKSTGMGRPWISSEVPTIPSMSESSVVLTSLSLNFLPYTKGLITFISILFRKGSPHTFSIDGEYYYENQYWLSSASKSFCPQWKAFQDGPNSERQSTKVGNILVLTFRVKGMAQI